MGETFFALGHGEFGFGLGADFVHCDVGGVVDEG
jgi:hypothetical protein